MNNEQEIIVAAVNCCDRVNADSQGDEYVFKRDDVLLFAKRLATPAATTSGAAGTIDEFLYAPGGMMPAQPGRGGWHRTQDVVAAVAAAREEEREKLEAAHSRALTLTEMEARNVGIAEGIEQERARLRAAPVVGEAVAWMHVLPDGEVFGDEPGQDKQALLSKSDAEGEVRVHGGTIRPLIFGDTAPHAAKEAGKVDEREATFKENLNVGGWKEAAIAWEVCASIHRQYAKGKDALFKTRQADYVRHAEQARAALARTTNKETK